MGLGSRHPSATFPNGMATLGALVEIIATVEGISSERVAAIARAVREAELIASYGRGPSAAQMSATDAANLLIAVNAAETARNAPDTVRRFRELRTDKKPQQQFGQVFEELITAAIKDGLVDNLLDLNLGPSRISRDKLRSLIGSFEMRIDFRHDRPMAVIECRLPTTAMPKSIPFFPAHEKRVVHANVDRRAVTQITHETILAIAETLRG
jgi:hypothetical protein